jgi:hypothetical protein
MITIFSLDDFCSLQSVHISSEGHVLQRAGITRALHSAALPASQDLRSAMKMVCMW